MKALLGSWLGVMCRHVQVLLVQSNNVGPASLNIITVKRLLLPWRLVKHEVLILDGPNYEGK